MEEDNCSNNNVNNDNGDDDMNSNQRIYRSDHDKNSSFLSSMTFATAGSNGLLLRCDCDECNVLSGNRNNSMIPETIRDAIREYKRQKVTIKRTQNRILIKQQEFCQDKVAVAVWQWIMPMNAEPLLEFSNPNIYRIIWVQRLDNTISCMKRIGKGIIGSAAEEQDRIVLDWKQNDVLLIPPTVSNSNNKQSDNNNSSNNTALGWIATLRKDKDDEEEKHEQKSCGPAVLYIAKINISESNNKDAITSNNNSHNNHENDNSESWYETIRSICIRTIDQFYKQDSVSQSHQRLCENDAKLFIKTIQKLFNQS